MLSLPIYPVSLAICRVLSFLACHKFLDFVLRQVLPDGLPPGGPNTYQIMYGEISDFQYQYQQWQHKMPERKINFAVNLTLKFFSATITNADTGSFKSLHTFL